MGALQASAMPDKRCCWSLADKAINRSDSENTHTNGMREATKSFRWSKEASSSSIVVQEGRAQLPTISDFMSEELHNVMGEIHSIDEGKVEWHVLNNSSRATLFGIASSRVGPHAYMSAKQHTTEYCMFPSFRLEDEVSELVSKGDLVIITLDKDKDHVTFKIQRENENEVSLLREEAVGIQFCRGGARLAIQFDSQFAVAGHEVKVIKVLQTPDIKNVLEDQEIEFEAFAFRVDRQDDNIVSTQHIFSLPSVHLKKGLEGRNLKGLAAIPPKFHTIISSRFEKPLEPGQIMRWKIRNLSHLTTLFGICGPKIKVDSYMFKGFTSKYCMYSNNGLLQANFSKIYMIKDKKQGLPVRSGDTITITLSHDKKPSTVTFAVNGVQQGEPIVVPVRRDAWPEDLRLCVQFQSGWHGPGHKIVVLSNELHS